MQKAAVFLEKAIDIVLFLIFFSVLATFPVLQQRQFLFIGLQIFFCALGFGRRSSRSMRLSRARGAIIIGYLLVIYLWNLQARAGHPGPVEWNKVVPSIFWIIVICFIAWLTKMLLSEKEKFSHILFSPFGTGVLIGTFLFAGAGLFSFLLYKRGLLDNYLGLRPLWPYFVLAMGYFMLTERMDSIRKTRLYLGNLIFCLGVIVVIKLIMGLI